jgi:hypothetical protein
MQRGFTSHEGDFPGNHIVCQRFFGDLLDYP